VVCALDLQHYDDPRDGYRSAKRALTELRRLGKLDDTVRSTRLRRTEPLTVELCVVVDAATASAAFEHCNAMLRAAVHASGGMTAGWDQVDLEVDTDMTRRRRSRTRRASIVRQSVTQQSGAQQSGAQQTRQVVAHLPGTSDGVTVADWAAAAEAARLRGAIPDSLPPLSWLPSDAVVDLRAG